MAIIGIVAVAKNNAIGKDGKLPWHYPADLKHFKETTSGHAVVMGMNTWRSIGRPLPNRLNIVLSRSAQIDRAENLIFLRSEKEAIDLAKFLKCDLFVIGGSKTYTEFAQFIDRWVVTEVAIEVNDADTFLPSNLFVGFTLVQRSEISADLTVSQYEKVSRVWIGKDNQRCPHRWNG